MSRIESAVLRRPRQCRDPETCPAEAEPLISVTASTGCSPEVQLYRQGLDQQSRTLRSPGTMNPSRFIG